MCTSRYFYYPFPVDCTIAGYFDLDGSILDTARESAGAALGMVDVVNIRMATNEPVFYFESILFVTTGQ